MHSTSRIYVAGHTGLIGSAVVRGLGAPRKLLDSTRMRGLGWKPQTDFVQGLRTTYEWYLNQLKTS